MSRLIETGQVGQQLCLFAAREGLEAFITPTVRDGVTRDMLGLTKGQDPILYLFGFGLSAEPAFLLGSGSARRPMKSC